MPVVIDANIAVALVVPLEFSPSCERRFAAWREARVPLYAPALWGYEVTSALRKAVTHGAISNADAQAGLHALSRLLVIEVPSSLELMQKAFAWAGCLGQRVAYDGAYLALAEELGVSLWTADRSLVRNARQLGLNWVRWIATDSGEPDA